jgi:hypothetical protein
MSTPEPRQSWRQAYIWVLDRVARLYYALCPKVGGNITQDPEWCDMSSEDRGGNLRVYGGMQPLVWEELRLYVHGLFVNDRYRAD